MKRARSARLFGYHSIPLRGLKILGELGCTGLGLGLDTAGISWRALIGALLGRCAPMGLYRGNCCCGWVLSWFGIGWGEFGSLAKV